LVAWELAVLQAFAAATRVGLVPIDGRRHRRVESSRDLAKEPMRIVRVFSRLPTSFRMPADMVLRRKNRRFVRRLRMDVKDPRFLVIDPDDGVRRHDLMIRSHRSALDRPAERRTPRVRTLPFWCLLF